MNTRKLTHQESVNLACLNSAGIRSVLLFITATGLDKAIMDATEPMRRLLKDQGVHDYGIQKQGPAYKVMQPAKIVTDAEMIGATVSLYRPVTKSGDPRMWFSNFKQFADAGNVCAVFVYEDCVYALNMSRSTIGSLIASGIETPVTKFLKGLEALRQSVAAELLLRLRQLASQGPIKAVGTGDTSVGRTVEAALGIKINSSKAPDYCGIELKSGRSQLLSKQTRSTLFACVADWSLSNLKSSTEILNRFGYQRGKDFKLYCTVSTLNPNSQGLQFCLDDAERILKEIYTKSDPAFEVCLWKMATLHSSLLNKHRETFWIKADSIKRDGGEWFQLQSVTHTTSPSVDQFDRLLGDGTVTMDHLIKRKPSGRGHEKGPLFKIEQNQLQQLFFGLPRKHALLV